MSDTNTYIIAVKAGLKREERRYPLEDVAAFFASNKYTMARMTDGAEVFPCRLQAPQETFHRGTSSQISLLDIEGWLARIGNHQFVRAHRGWLPNMQHVGTYRQNPDKTAKHAGELISSDGSAIPVSRRHVVETRKAFRQGVFA